MSATNASTQYVFRGRGEHSVRVPICDAATPSEMRIPTIADAVPARWIMSRDVVCARDNLDVDALIDLMVHKRVGCVPIVDHDGCPIGMVTKQDLLELVIAAREPDAATPLVTRQLMMPLAFTLDEHATIAHAAAMMSVEGVHHVPIVAESGCLLGVVSTLDIVRWLATNDGLLDVPAGG